MIYPLTMDITRIQVIPRQRSHKRKRIAGSVGRDEQILPLFGHAHHVLDAPDALQFFLVLDTDIQVSLIHIPCETLERTAVAVGGEIRHIGIGIVHKPAFVVNQIDIRLDIGGIQLYIFIGERAQMQIGLVGQNIVFLEMKQTGSQARPLQFQFTGGIQLILIHHQRPFVPYTSVVHGKRLFGRCRQQAPPIFQIHDFHLLALRLGPAVFQSVHCQQRRFRPHRIWHHQNVFRLKITAVQRHIAVGDKPFLAQLYPVLQIPPFIQLQPLLRRPVLHTQRIVRQQPQRILNIRNDIGNQRTAESIPEFVRIVDIFQRIGLNDEIKLLFLVHPVADRRSVKIDIRFFGRMKNRIARHILLARLIIRLIDFDIPGHIPYQGIHPTPPLARCLVRHIHSRRIHLRQSDRILVIGEIKLVPEHIEHSRLQLSVEFHIPVFQHNHRFVRRLHIHILGFADGKLLYPVDFQLIVPQVQHRVRPGILRQGSEPDVVVILLPDPGVGIMKQPLFQRHFIACLVKIQKIIIRKRNNLLSQLIHRLLHNPCIITYRKSIRAQNHRCLVKTVKRMDLIDSLHLVVKNVIEKIQRLHFRLEHTGTAIHAHCHTTAVHRPNQLLHTKQYLMIVIAERQVLTLLRNTLHRHRMVLAGVRKTHIGMKKTAGSQRQNHPGDARHHPCRVYRKTGGIHIHVGRVIRRNVHARRQLLITEARQFHAVILHPPLKRNAGEQRIDFYIRIVRNELRETLLLIHGLVFQGIVL